jgi:hypothetical protein
VIRQPWPLVLLAALALASGACTSGSESGAAPTSTVAPSTTTVPPSSTSAPAETNEVEQQVLAAYTGMWTATAEAAETSNHQSPALARYATGEALTRITQSLLTDRQRGVVTKGRPILGPRVVSLTPPETPNVARVEDCGDSTGWLKYKTSGELVDDEPGGRRRIEAVVRLADGGWKVSDFVVQGVGTC